MSILVFCDHDNGQFGAATLNAVSAAQQIGGDIHLLVAGDTSCLLYTSPSPRDLSTSRMPSSA